MEKDWPNVRENENKTEREGKQMEQKGNGSIDAAMYCGKTKKDTKAESSAFGSQTKSLANAEDGRKTGTAALAGRKGSNTKG